MKGRSFLDTNILVYTDDEDAPEKKRRALDLFADCRRKGHGVVSTQILQEYFATATKKLGVDPVVARRKTEIFARLDVVSLNVDAQGGVEPVSRSRSWRR